MGYLKSFPAESMCDLVSQTCVSEKCNIDVANGYIVGESNNVGDNTTLTCLPGFVNNIDNSSRIDVSWYENKEMKMVFKSMYYKYNLCPIIHKSNSIH